MLRRLSIPFPACPMKSFSAVASIVFGALLLSACSFSNLLSPYRVDIRQGNYVTQEMVAQLKPGMTKDQVRFALGTPLVSDMFHGERWDYLYRFKPGVGEVQQRHLAVYFDQGKLVRVGGDVVASGNAVAEQAAAPAAAPKVIEIGSDGKVKPAAAAAGDKPAN
jgi:outer membrane protein assembly factor BamE